jgi:hypothetical protein
VDLPKILCEAYHKDTMFSKIMVHPEVHKKFRIRDRLIWTKNQLQHNIVCMPWNVFHGGMRMIEIIINHAPNSWALQPTENFELRTYWWPSMATNIKLFCTSYTRCQMHKMSTQQPKGLLHSLPILDRSWQLIGIDFMGALPKRLRLPSGNY